MVGDAANYVGTSFVKAGDVTYNAITTDFWQNLDATSGKESWKMFGSPRCRIRRIMVGAAYS